MPSSSRKVPYGLIAFWLYTISIALPAIVAIHKPILWGSSYDEVMYGLQCLLIGWLTLPWYANIALWIAGIALAAGRSGVATVFSLIAIGLALTMFGYVDTYVRAPHVGYGVWLASMGVVLVGARVQARRRWSLDVIPAADPAERVPGATSREPRGT